MSKHKSAHHRSAHPQAAKEPKQRIVREDSLPVEPDRRVPQASSVADAARQSMIAEAAYYLAQKRGFEPGREVDDWLAAEAEIAESLLEQPPDAADLH